MTWLSVKRLSSRDISIVIVFSTAGAVSSFVVGYTGSFIGSGSPIIGQSLAGLHVLWLTLAAVLTKSRGAATLAGILKGSVELLFPGHLGPFVFLLSFFEGVVVDLALLPAKTFDRKSLLLASGLSSSSNVFVLQIFQLLPVALPAWIFLGMYLVSFFSGLILGGYLVTLIFSRIDLPLNRGNKVG